MHPLSAGAAIEYVQWWPWALVVAASCVWASEAGEVLSTCARGLPRQQMHTAQPAPAFLLLYVPCQAGPCEASGTHLISSS